MTEHPVYLSMEKTLAAWKHSLRVSYPRAGLPWSLAEDRQLRRLSLANKTVNFMAEKHGRTPDGILTRLYILQVRS